MNHMPESALKQIEQDSASVVPAYVSEERPGKASCSIYYTTNLPKGQQNRIVHHYNMGETVSSEVYRAMPEQGIAVERYFLTIVDVNKRFAAALKRL